ncbi:MAG: hypothetical protein HY817_02150 [Candidatus Abawacabacteria bacterium]|nr:hypothetical protein [Candidatus Abawacabacteria bacterium]
MLPLSTENFYLMLFFGSICGLLLISVFVHGWGKEHFDLPIWLGAKKQKVLAKVIGVEQISHTSKSFETEIGYQIKYSWFDAQKKRTYTFLSTVLHQDPQDYLPQTMDVYINAENKDIYWIDVSNIITKAKFKVFS